MGLTRKLASASTLGGIKYTSKREAQTKNASAQARLAKAETKALKNQGRAAAADQRQANQEASAAKWEPILAAITAGDASWDDLTRMQKLTMPIGYQLKCKAASRNLASGAKWFVGTAPGAFRCDHHHPSQAEAAECGNKHIRGES